MTDRIQSSNRESKTYISVGIAGGVTAIIALVWITTLPAHFVEEISLNEKETRDADVPKKDTQGVFDRIVEDAKTQLGNIIQSSNTMSNQSEIPTDTKLNTLSHDAPVVSVPKSEEIVVPAELSENVLETAPSFEHSITASTAPSNIPDVSVVEKQIPRVILIGTSTSETNP